MSSPLFDVWADQIGKQEMKFVFETEKKAVGRWIDWSSSSPSRSEVEFEFRNGGKETLRRTSSLPRHSWSLSLLGHDWESLRRWLSWGIRSSSHSWISGTIVHFQCATFVHQQTPISISIDVRRVVVHLLTELVLSHLFFFFYFFVVLIVVELCSSNVSVDQQANNAFYNCIDSAPDIPERGKTVPLELDMVRTNRRISVTHSEREREGDMTDWICVCVC